MFQGKEHLFIACYLADIESHTHCSDFIDSAKDTLATDIEEHGFSLMFSAKV